MAGRAKNSIMTGDILFDGINPKQFHSNGNCGYVQQFDYLMPHLTVRETLMYTAELRLPSTMSIIEKRQSVESVILELGLKECADTVIGDSWVKGISGGEKRRVSVGCQLLLNPSILFLDEPTTGLDAYSSHNLIETLKSLADRGRTIFITIHQPRSDIFNIFDSVILLAKGNMVYAGPAGTTIMNYFENLGFACPLNINPADYIIDITSVDGRTEEDKSFTETRVSKLIQDWITNTAKLSMEKSNTILSQDSIMESKDIDDKFPKSIVLFEFRLLSSNEFTDNVYKCEDVGRPCEGNSILESLAIERNDYTYTYIGLVGNWLVFMILSIVLLQYYKIDPTKHAKQLQKTKKKKEVVEMELKEFNSRKVDLTLKNVSLELTTKPMFRSATNKMLLSNISGTFSHSSLSIVMGGSGTGKSTLLSLLCGRSLSVGSNSKMKQSGSILFNGKEIKDQSIISSICSFVRQSDDHLLPSLTCRETLVYAARLRLPQSFTEDMKVSRALEVLRLLGLSHCADTIVGSETSKGLSGGEKRRLSIGIQMLVDPSVLIIDEPTSGLDAFTAHHIMETLKSIANTGRTIICSIHQPRSDIFVMFDHILLLTLGGRVAYSGSAKSIIPYFQQMDIDIPTHINPADLILDVTSIDFRNSLAEQQSKKRIEDIITVWKNTGNNVDLEKSSVIDQLDVGEIYARKMLPMSKAFPILLERSYLNIKREPTILLSRILQVVSLGIIQALFFTPQGNDQASVQNRLGILQQSNSVLFVGLLNCVAAFPTEKAVLFYEYNDRAYSVESFFLAYNLLEIPVEIVSAFLFTIFTQIVVGLNVSWTNYICMSLAIFGLVNTGESIGIMFTSIVGHVGFSVSMTSCVLGIFTVMSGIMSSDMPLFLDRINRISPVPYFARLMVVNEFDSTSRFTCTTEEKSTQQCLYETGDDVLRLLKGSADTMSFDPNQVSFYLVVGMALAVFYRLVSYLLLRYRTMSN
ncbi:hypothetical protein HDV02_001649 [Globomyces sp. JEL0801]|nr:hypothetical protein HDV02_001649 [Globomyces sp. JEL0801]